ncbi:ABC transporter permease [Serinicoccus chungangensis]|uniref:ABC transporter permease n=1 Tax=Serinicoccus chungangensis TaxID=767452 RepID=UPI001118641C|nr:ABC transporter permease [Serinicoccus chungangensis]
MSTRAPWTLVAAREIQVKLTDKNFLIGTGLTILLLLAVLVVPSLLGSSSPDYDVAVTDDRGAAVVAEVDDTLRAEDEEASATAVEVADRDAAESAVLEGDVDAALVAGDGTWELLSDGPDLGALQGLLSEQVRADALADNARSAGTTVEALTAGSEVAVVDVGQEEGGMPPVIAYVLGFAFAGLFYFAAIMFGMQIANSVVEEKQSRIIEILAAKIPTRQLLLGKVLGNTVLAFGQLALIAAVSLVGMTFVDLDVALPGLVGAIAWYLPFFLLGFLALACVWAAAGALASRTEDLQQTTMPLTMVLVVLFIAGVNLEGTARQVFSFLPVASTLVMPMRILEGDTQLWEPVLALVLVVVFCALTITLGSRLYERALLHTSGSLSWRRAMALSKD